MTDNLAALRTFHISSVNCLDFARVQATDHADALEQMHEDIGDDPTVSHYEECWSQSFWTYRVTDDAGHAEYFAAVDADLHPAGERGSEERWLE